jgi:hypothetical protein
MFQLQCIRYETQIDAGTQIMENFLHEYLSTMVYKHVEL